MRDIFDPVSISKVPHSRGLVSFLHIPIYVGYNLDTESQHLHFSGIIVISPPLIFIAYFWLKCPQGTSSACQITEAVRAAYADQLCMRQGLPADQTAACRLPSSASQ